jgi:hypothetical protein
MYPAEKKILRGREKLPVQKKTAVKNRLTF